MSVFLFLTGPVQAQLRSGNVRKPSNVQDIYVPVQNMYKHVKFWSSNPAVEGKVYVKPLKSKLKRQFTRQLNQIWDVSVNHGADIKDTLETLVKIFCFIIW